MTEGQQEVFMMKKGVMLKVKPSKTSRLKSKINKILDKENNEFWYIKHEGEYFKGYIAGENFIVYAGVLKGNKIPIKDLGWYGNHFVSKKTTIIQW